MQEQYFANIKVNDEDLLTTFVHIGPSNLIWHVNGVIKGQCKLSDLVFCHYYHKTHEVTIVALPRVLSITKREMRERELLRISFFNIPKSKTDPESLHNNSYIIYKKLHNHMFNAYQSNLDSLLKINKRFIYSEDEFITLQKHLRIDAAQSFMQMYAERHIYVIINPHGGNTKARKTWDTIVKPFFDFINIHYMIQLTSYAHHAEELGIHFDYTQFDSVLFISGDGTVNEFLNGILSRQDARLVLLNCTFGAISAGSQNSFARGMGTNSVYTALYCLINRKTRFYDSICVENGNHICRYSFAGCGWGIISDMVQDYERYRWFKQYRYWLLKGIHGFFCLRHHYCSYKYIEGDNQIRLLCSHKYPNCAECIEQAESYSSKILLIPRANTNIDLSSDTNLSLSSTESISDKLSIQEQSKDCTVDDIINRLISYEYLSIEYSKQVWYEDEGSFHTIGVINTSPDSKWCHISLKGSCFKDISTALSYVIGQEFNSGMLSYIKAKVLEINSTTDHVIMIDGEVFPGPFPFRFVCIPCLLTVFGEY